MKTITQKGDNMSEVKIKEFKCGKCSWGYKCVACRGNL